MTLSEKLERLIKESDWRIAAITRKLGRDDPKPVLRWLGRTDTGRPSKGTPKPKSDGSDRRARESTPTRLDLIGLSEIFGVDIRWLIDDSLDWDDRLKSDSLVLTRIRRLPEQAQLEMLEWHLAGQPAREAKPDPEYGANSGTNVSQPTRPNTRVRQKRGDIASSG